MFKHTNDEIFTCFGNNNTFYEFFYLRVEIIKNYVRHKVHLFRLYKFEKMGLETAHLEPSLNTIKEYIEIIKLFVLINNKFEVILDRKNCYSIDYIDLKISSKREKFSLMFIVYQCS